MNVESFLFSYLITNMSYKNIVMTPEILQLQT